VATPPTSAAPPRARKTIPIVALSTGLYEAHRKVYPRSVSGRFNQLRWLMVWVTQVVFYGLPWLPWGERQAVLFDLDARRFYLPGLVLYPQDLIYLTGLLVVSALALFLFTAVAGRLWCGYACPQTVYTGIFMWVEQRIEGSRIARMRLDGEPFSAEKLVKKWFKHLVWLGIALWTGFTFVGYFTPIRELALAFVQTRMGSWEVFWVFFYGFATYGNAGFMREQVCKYMCPYARFQGAMFDRDTLIVSYDEPRGEPRGLVGKGRPAASRGDCIDCGLCVQVCPTGIDIRQGQQYECIGCGLCADACDTVMQRVKKPPGLVRYATQNSMAGGWPARRIWQHVARPRVLVYAALLAALSIGLLASLVTRTPLKVDVVRDRGSLAHLVEGGRLENVYRLQIMNATERAQRYRVAVDGLPGLGVSPSQDILVEAAASRWVAVRVQAPHDVAAPGAHAIRMLVQQADGVAQVAEKTTFVVPR
jgi:cytochrome c oxidase accessory protein FixG